MLKKFVKIVLIVFLAGICFITINGDNELKAEKASEEEIINYVQDLGDNNFMVMQEAREQLVEIGPRVIPFLEELIINSDERWAQTNAIFVLEAFENVEAVRAISFSLNAVDSNVRQKGIESLSSLGEDNYELVLPVIKDKLLSSDDFYRQNSLQILKNINLPEKEIVDIVYENSIEGSRDDFLRGLKQLENMAESARHLVSSLVELAHESDTELTSEIMSVMSKIGGQEVRNEYPLYLELLLNQNSKISKKAVQSLIRLDFTAEEITQPVIVKIRRNEDNRKNYINNLINISFQLEEAAFKIIELLEDEDLDQNIRDKIYELLTKNVPRMEYHINRGLVAVDIENGVYLKWRLLGTEPYYTPFHVYRNGERINEEPIIESTNFIDKKGTIDDIYQVKKISKNNTEEVSREVEVWEDNYKTIPLDIPEDGEVKGESYHYIANDASAADLTGDGNFEIILMWEPSNARDNAHSGFTGNVLIDAYTMEGEKLWRIDLGKNIRAGAHYTQFMVYDFNNSGRAELAVKTADGTQDSRGNIIGDPEADWRNEYGYVLDGPEYLTVFDGITGRILDTTDYYPPRGNVSDWGDDYGNRVDRFLAGVAYLDGKKPSLIMCRGYYTRTVLAAYNLIDGKLQKEWVFDSDKPGLTEYAGQGSHSLSIADVDLDGKQEIVYGAMVVDNDGSGLYSTGIGHGDALHVSNFNPDRFGQEVFDLAESSAAPYGAYMRDAETGEILWGVYAGADVGRGVAANIDPERRGAEAWATAGIGMFDIEGNHITNNIPSVNYAIWWDGDLTRELLDGIRIDKWVPETEDTINLFTGTGVSSINGTKATPNLQADLFGDWREEVVWRTADNSALKIYTTTHKTSHRIHTLMHNLQYRTAVAWQNSGYNQPPHPDFYLGPEEKLPKYNPGLAYKALKNYRTENNRE